MNAQKLKEAIVQKYGSVNRFCQLVGLQSTDMYGYLNRQPSNPVTLEEIRQLYEKTPNRLINRVEVTLEERKLIRASIYNNYHNLSEFARQHPRYSQSWLSILINGKMKRKTPKVKQLLELLSNE